MSGVQIRTPLSLLQTNVHMIVRMTMPANPAMKIARRNGVRSTM